MNNIKEYCFEKKEALIEFCDRHPWVVPTLSIMALGVFAINEVSNNNAMRYGYDRLLKAGNLEICVCKSKCLPRS